MPKKVKNKVQDTEDDPEGKIIKNVEIIYEDTKPFTGVEPEFRWGQIY